MVQFFNVTRRMAVIPLSGSRELRISRSKRDGSTVGIHVGGLHPWKTLNVQDLLDALAYVTYTDEKLRELGFSDVDIKPSRKRNYKAEYARRKAKKESKDDDDLDLF